MNRRLGSIVVLAGSLVAAGCTMHQTPDGHELWSGSGRESVRAELGEPDLVEEADHAYFGPYHVTTLTYLNRGYTVRLEDNWVRGVRTLSADERPDLERRARAYREELPKIKIGDTQLELLARFGPPDHVRSGTMMNGGGKFQTCQGAYLGQLEAAPAIEWAECFWRGRYVRVELRDGVVVEKGPLTAWYLEHAMGEAAPVKP